MIGSGLTGLAISRCLASASIDHVLIGRPPEMSPRLGESMNLEGTLLLWEMFPELSRFFFPKREVLGYFGDYELVCDFDVAQRAVSRGIFRTLGFAPAGEFLQVDRVGFDAALWDVTTANPHCAVLRAPIADLAFDTASDRVASIRLDDGTTLRPSYAFDGSNHGRLLGRAAGLTHRTLGEPQRVVYTHYHLAADAPRAKESWELTTAIVRLFADSDGLDAIAWCIPLGTYVSVGLSMTDSDTAPDDETLLEYAADAFTRYGIDYRRRFANRVDVKGLRHRYFAYDRAAGANWLLAGPSFAQVWWMAGAGVGTALAAAQLAPKLLQDPQRWGAEYDRYMRQLLPIHDTFDFFALSPRDAYAPNALHRFSDRFVVTNLVRLAGSTRLRESRLAQVAAPAMDRLFRHPSAIRNYCAVKPVQATVRDAAGETLVRRLLAVVSGDAPMSDATRLLASDVVCHMDGYTTRGTQVWVDWVEFLRANAGGAVRADVERCVTNADGTITAFGSLRAAHATDRAPQQDRATYRIADGRIAEIWTTRENYEAVFGAKVRHPLRWLLVLSELAVRRRLARPLGGHTRSSRNPGAAG